VRITEGHREGELAVVIDPNDKQTDSLERKAAIAAAYGRVKAAAAVEQVYLDRLSRTEI
jgi:hypothetical protein